MITANLIGVQGEAWEIDLAVIDGAGAAVNITGWALAFTVRTWYGRVLEMQKTTGAGITITNAAGGLARVAVPRAAGGALTVGSHVWDLWRTDAGAEAALAGGALTVKPTVY